MLREMNELAQLKHYVAVQFEDLAQAYESGLDEFLASLRNSAARSDFAIKKAVTCLGTASQEDVKSLLEWGKSVLGRRD
jgi:hypothetical protein